MGSNKRWLDERACRPVSSALEPGAPPGGGFQTAGISVGSHPHNAKNTPRAGLYFNTERTTSHKEPTFPKPVCMHGTVVEGWRRRLMRRGTVLLFTVMHEHKKKRVKRDDGYFAAVMQNTCTGDAAVRSALLQKCSPSYCHAGLK